MAPWCTHTATPPVRAAPQRKLTPCCRYCCSTKFSWYTVSISSLVVGQLGGQHHNKVRSRGATSKERPCRWQRLARACSVPSAVLEPARPQLNTLPCAPDHKAIGQRTPRKLLGQRPCASCCCRCRAACARRLGTNAAGPVVAELNLRGSHPHAFFENKGGGRAAKPRAAVRYQRASRRLIVL
jgi:hypothetical protein